jgi:LPS-assembly lipoprotein
VRALLIAMLGLLLSACGFQPTNVIKLSKVSTPFAVNSQNPYSSLADNIERALSANGVKLARSGESAYAITINSEQSDTNPLSLDQFAQVREYVARYRVVYSLSDSQGNMLIDKQEVELRREYSYDLNTSAGSPAELELLQREMQAEMIQSILRRTNIILQAQ